MVKMARMEMRKFGRIMMWMVICMVVIGDVGNANTRRVTAIDAQLTSNHAQKGEKYEMRGMYNKAIWETRNIVEWELAS